MCRRGGNPILVSGWHAPARVGASLAETQFTYSDDGLTLTGCTSTEETVTVPPGCRTIGQRAFSRLAATQEVVLPDTVEVVDSFAFARSSIRRFKAPASLRKIGIKAFFACNQLAEISLNDGLEEILGEAFSQTALTSIRLPRTLSNMGFRIAEQTPLALSAGADGDFALIIDAANPHLRTDGKGGIYRIRRSAHAAAAEKAYDLVDFLSETLTSLNVLPGTESIAPRACSGRLALERVTLPDSMILLDSFSFLRCRNLTQINFPEGLECLGEGALSETALTDIHLPSTLWTMGLEALATGPLNGCPTLRTLTVHPDNPQYFAHEGILYDWYLPDYAVALLQFGQAETIHLHPQAYALGLNFFRSDAAVGEFIIHQDIKVIVKDAFAKSAFIPRVSFQLQEPCCGKDRLELHFSDRNMFRQAFGQAFSSGIVNLRVICAYYDDALASMAAGYHRTRLIARRLACPQFMAPMDTGRLNTLLASDLEPVCRQAAACGDTALYVQLADLGALTAENIGRVIDAVSAVGDTAATATLLELRRSRFGTAEEDFSL